METFQFDRFARNEKCWLGTSDIVDVCMDAMEEGTLPVIAKQWGFYYLWEFYFLRTHQWARLCGLLQRNRLPPSLLWRLESLWTFVSDAALTQLEFLWQDLDAVRAWLELPNAPDDAVWIAGEVARRRQWPTGLRRAWLLTVVTGGCVEN